MLDSIHRWEKSYTVKSQIDFVLCPIGVDTAVQLVADIRSPIGNHMTHILMMRQSTIRIGTNENTFNLQMSRGAVSEIVHSRRSTQVYVEPVSWLW